MMFIHCSVGQVGSVNDSRVLRLSEVNSYLREPGLDKFVNGDHHLLGDAAYPVIQHLMAPYKETGALTQRHRNFNKKLSSTRMVIERTFGHLKCRWRRLQKLNMSRIDLVPKTVIACCVLHNFCIIQNDPNFEIVREDEQFEENVAPNNEANCDAIGIAKRDLIRNALPQRGEQ